MVRATTSLETERIDLKSVEGGWVELRPMTYGQYLHRRDMAMKMGISGAALQGKGGANEKLDLEVLQEEVTRYEFKTCIVDHNLEDVNDRKLVLSRSDDFEKLDPKIGQEVQNLIDERNKWEDPKSDGDMGDGDQPSDLVSQDSTTG